MGKFSQYLKNAPSPQDFGANGRGTNDDTAAWQAAINAVRTSNTYPNSVGNGRPNSCVRAFGKYTITKSLDFTSVGNIYGLGIVGEGSLNTWIDAELTEVFPALDFSGMGYAFIRGLQIRASSSSKATAACLLAEVVGSAFNNRNGYFEDVFLAIDATMTSANAVAGFILQNGDLFQARNLTAQGRKGMICGSVLPAGVTSKFQAIGGTPDQTSYSFKQSTFIGPQPVEIRKCHAVSFDDVYIQGGNGGSSGSLDSDTTGILVSDNGSGSPFYLYGNNVRTENQTANPQFYAITFDDQCDLLKFSGALDIVPNVAVNPTGAVIRTRGNGYVTDIDLHGISESFLGTPPVIFDLPNVGGNAASGKIRSLTGQFRADGGPGTLGTSIEKFNFDWINPTLDSAWAAFLNTYLLPSDSIPTFSTRAVSRYNAVETILAYTPVASAPVVRYAIEAGLLKTQVRQKLNADLSMFSLQAVEFSLYIVQTATGISQQMGDVPAASAAAGYSAQMRLLINERTPGVWEAGASIIYGHNAGGGVSAFSSAVATLTNFDPTLPFAIEVWGASASANPIAPFAALFEVS